MPTFTFDVFLSHHSGDKPTVETLKASLAPHQISSWLDKDELPPGQNWQPLLDEGLRNSRAIAACVGKVGIGPWQDEEIQSAMRLAVKDKRPVIPLLLPGAAHEPELPPFLANRTWVDCRAGFTEDALLRLLWGITGVKPAGLGGSSPPPPPIDPEARVREVFGPLFEPLKDILDRHPQLRQALSTCYRLPSDTTPATTARLILAFQANFLKALAHFSNLYDERAAGAEALLELVSSVLYLSMCPDVAAQVKEQASNRVFVVSPDAKNGIAEMLVAWKRYGGSVPVPVVNLSTEKDPQVFETPPQLLAETIKHDLMTRLGIDRRARDADRQLEARLQFRDLRNRPEFLALSQASEADKEVIRLLQDTPELRHLVLLIKAEGASINPSADATNRGYDFKLEQDLAEVLRQLSALRSGV
jgi:hypothetical protein